MPKRSFNIIDDFKTAVSLGLIEDISHTGGVASEDGLVANTPVILGTGTLDPEMPPDAGTTIEIYNATPSNVGADILLQVLDVNFEPITLMVPIVASGVGAPVLDPTTGQPMVITRINNAFNLGPRGTGEIATGTTLDIRDIATPATVYGQLKDTQEMQQAIFTVPAGFKFNIVGLLTTMRKSGGSDTDVVLTLIAGRVGSVLRRVLPFGLQRSGNTIIEFANSVPTATEGPYDLRLEVESSSSGASVGARISIQIIK